MDHCPKAAPPQMMGRISSINAVGSRPSILEIYVFDEKNNPIHKQYVEEIDDIYDVIYGWDPVAWEKQLQQGDGMFDEKTLENKKNLFWEALAQNFAEYAFGDQFSPAPFVYGPDCFAKAKSCASPGIKSAARIVIKTTTHGDRDPLNPVTRTIYWEASRDTLRNPEVAFKSIVPAGLKVASDHQEILDFRPQIDDIEVESMEILVEIDERRRIEGTDYPDFNNVFLPARHLLLQAR